MTLMERRNYQIAIMVSILFHLALLLIWIPSISLHDMTKLETIGAGLIDLSGGGEPFQTAALEVAANPEVENVKQLPTQNGEKLKLLDAKTDTKPAPAIPEPSKNAAVVEAKPTTKTQTAQAAASTGNAHPTTGANPLQKPTSIALGDGSGMIAGTGGGKLRAPKNVQNDENEGEVTLLILVKPDGTLEDITISKPSGDERLDNHTRNAIRREWKFKTNKDPYQIEVAFNYQKANNYEPVPRFISSKTRP